MGTLVIRHYPTSLFLKAADHTYVECGSGAKGWACWGGKENGKFRRQGSGSTRRADAIAEIDEKANITCYLINGVCHQASNRILRPAKITADGVRGYTLSVIAFGPYGRERTRYETCRAPLLDYADVSGDLPQCAGEPKDGGPGEPVSATPLYDYQDQNYMSAVAALYASDDAARDTSVRGLYDSQMELFKLLIAHKVRRGRRSLANSKYERLMEARARFELGRLEAEHEIAGFDSRVEFAGAFDKLTLTFQDEAAEILDSQEYEALLDLSRDERIVVSDPDILNGVYEPKPGPRGATP